MRVAPALLFAACLAPLAPGTARAVEPAYLNLLDYGADNTGAPGSEAANGAAFRSALAALCAAEGGHLWRLANDCGGVIWIPPGKYLLNQTVDITQDVQIVGSGENSAIVWTGANSADENGGRQPIVFNFSATPTTKQSNAGISNASIIAARILTLDTFPAGDPETLSVAVALNQPILGNADDAGYRYPISRYQSWWDNVSDMYILGFGIGILDGPAGSAPPINPIDGGFNMPSAMCTTLSHNTISYCNVGIYMTDDQSNADTLTDNSIGSANVGIWFRSGYADQIRGGAIQGCASAGILLNDASWEIDIESIDFENDGNLGSSFTQGCKGADGGYEGGSIVVNVANPAMSHYVFRNLNIDNKIDVCSSVKGGACGAQFVFDEINGAIRLSPECVAASAAPMQLTNSGNATRLLKAPQADGGTPPIVVFNADGFNGDNHLPASSVNESPSAVRVYDNGSVGLGYARAVTDPREAKLTLYGSDSWNRTGRLSGSDAGYPFHAIDILSQPDPARGNTEEIRFGSSDYIARYGEAAANASIDVVNTSPAGRRWIYSDMVFSTSGAPGAGVLAERMRITNAGAVGIGTSTPARTLDVAGDARISGHLTVESCTGCGVTAAAPSTIQGPLAFLAPGGFAVPTATPMRGCYPGGGSKARTWSSTANGGCIATGAITNANTRDSRTGLLRATTGVGHIASVAVGKPDLQADWGVVGQFTFQLESTDKVRTWAGYVESGSAAELAVQDDSTAFDYFGVRYSAAAGDSKLMLCAGNGSASACTPTGTVAAAKTTYWVTLWFTGSAAGTPTLTAFISTAGQQGPWAVTSTTAALPVGSTDVVGVFESVAATTKDPVSAYLGTLFEWKQ